MLRLVSPCGCYFLTFHNNCSIYCTSLGPEKREVSAMVVVGPPLEYASVAEVGMDCCCCHCLLKSPSKLIIKDFYHFRDF